MSGAADSSVSVEAMVAGLPHHDACRRLLEEGQLHANLHALSETFSTLTGGRLGTRIPAQTAVELIAHDLLPFVTFHALDGDEIMGAFRESQSRGVRGGAIHDYLHLVAARKAGAQQFYTLNISDFRSFHREGDPAIVHP
jgi:predicted nucleic acid-binding protein